MEEVIRCDEGIYFCRIDKDDRSKFFDGYYVLSFQKYESDVSANFYDWSVSQIWKNVIDEIEYVIGDTELPDGNILPWTSKYPDLKPEIISWLNETIGPFGVRWGYSVPTFASDETFKEFIGATTHQAIFFILKRDAMLFKLTWS